MCGRGHLDTRISHSGSKAQYEAGYQKSCVLGSVCLCCLLGPRMGGGGVGLHEPRTWARRARSGALQGSAPEALVMIRT